MEVEETLSEKSREVASSEQEEPYMEGSDIEDDKRNESDSGEEVASGPEEDEDKREIRDVLSDDDDDEDEEEDEDEEDYCPGGYHRISPGDLLDGR